MSFNPIKSATEMVKKVRVSSVLSSLLWILPFTIAGLVVVSFTNKHCIAIKYKYKNSEKYYIPDILMRLKNGNRAYTRGVGST